jgi:site-specific recombinase XerD
MTRTDTDLAAVAATGPTIERVRERYRRSLRARGLRPATVSIYLSALGLFDRFLAEQGMPRQLGAIKREHVESFLEWCAARPGRKGERASGSWVYLQHNSLVPFFKWAVEQDEIDRSPMEKIRPPKKDAPEKEPLTPEEVARLREVTRGRTFEKRRDRALLEVLLATGLRRRALASLTVDDVDEARGHIRVRAAAMKGRHGHIVHLTDDALDALGRYLSVRDSHPLARRTDALWLGVRRAPGGLPRIPRDDEDTREAETPPHGVSGDGLRQILERRGKEAKLSRGVGPHLFRHSAATMAARLGWSDRELMAHFGWADAGMARHYSRTADADIAQAAMRRKPLWEKKR